LASWRALFETRLLHELITQTQWLRCRLHDRMIADVIMAGKLVHGDGRFWTAAMWDYTGTIDPTWLITSVSLSNYFDNHPLRKRHRPDPQAEKVVEDELVGGPPSY
jgi:hypothetical protein